MGDEAFFDAMRSWVTRHRYGFVSADRFLGHLQAQADADLRPIFAAYLDDPTPWRPFRSTGVHPI